MLNNRSTYAAVIRQPDYSLAPSVVVWPKLLMQANSEIEMRLFLHIGSHKTGTSTFQQFLFDKRETGGWCYPNTGLWPEDRSHNLLAISFWDDVRVDLKTVSYKRQIQDLWDEISSCSHVILSSEMLEKVPLRGNTERLKHFIDFLLPDPR